VGLVYFVGTEIEPEATAILARREKSEIAFSQSRSWICACAPARCFELFRDSNPVFQLRFSVVIRLANAQNVFSNCFDAAGCIESVFGKAGSLAEKSVSSGGHRIGRCACNSS